MPLGQTVESAALQLRMTLEGIALASLVAHRGAYAAEAEDFATHWNAQRMFKRLRRLNPNFYPTPYVIGETIGVAINLELRPNADYLTEAEFEAAYNRLGALAHAPNPFASKLDYEAVVIELRDMTDRIINLLNEHVVHLINTDEIWVIQMQDTDTKNVVSASWLRKPGPGATH